MSCDKTDVPTARWVMDDVDAVGSYSTTDVGVSWLQFSAV